MSIWPPRNHGEESAELKKLVVGNSVTVCLPALMRSAILLALERKRTEAEHAVLGL